MFRLCRLFLVATVLAGFASAAETSEVAALRAKAEKGNGLAQYNLGLIYAEGEGVPADLPEAFVWLSLASSNGATGKALDQVLGNITDAQLAEGRRRLEQYRAAIAARVSTQPAAPAHKTTLRGFSLTPPESTPGAGAEDVPITKAPTVTLDANPQPVDELQRLKLELAQAKETILQQSAQIAQLKDELKRTGDPRQK